MSVVNCPLPSASYGNFKKFKIYASEYGTVSQFRACTYEFVTMVTECAAHGVHTVLIQLPFGITKRHKVTGGCSFCLVFIQQLPKVS